MSPSGLIPRALVKRALGKSIDTKVPLFCWALSSAAQKDAARIEARRARVLNPIPVRFEFIVSSFRSEAKARHRNRIGNLIARFTEPSRSYKRQVWPTPE